MVLATGARLPGRPLVHVSTPAHELAEVERQRRVPKRSNLIGNQEEEPNGRMAGRERGYRVQIAKSGPEILIFQPSPGCQEALPSLTVTLPSTRAA